MILIHYISNLILKSSLRLNQPYFTTSERIIHIIDGEATYIINLSEYNVRKGDILIIPSQSIVEINNFSDSYILQAISRPNTTNPDSSKVDQDNDCLVLSPSENDMNLISKHFELIANVIETQGYHSNVISSLSDALHSCIMIMYNHQEQNDSNKIKRHKDILIKKCFDVVKKHCMYNRNISFYAKTLYISNCYLSIVVKAETGHSVMYWINRELTYKAKIAIAYTDKTIAEISYDLNFCTTSFFCKFFKNATAMTPSQYRKNSV